MPQPIAQRQPQPSTAASFTEPATLHEFNARLRAFQLPGPLSPAEHRLLLERQPRDRVLRALIEIHNNGGGTNAARFLDRVIRNVQAEVAGGDGPRSDQCTFAEPTTLGQVNAFLTRFQIVRPLRPPEMDLLIEQVGRTELVAALRDIHAGAPDADAARDLLTHEANTAIVRVKRGDTAHRNAPLDDLPPESSDDHGFHGVSSPSPTQAPVREVRRPESASQPMSSRQEDRSLRSGSPQSPRPVMNTSRQHALQARAYGKRAALCVEASDGTKGPTLMVEMAPAVEGRDREYDWKNGKMRFQLTRKELLECLAILYDWAPSVEFANHGETKVKSLTLSNQDGGKLYIKLQDKGRPMLVIPVTEKDALAELAGLALAQTLKAFHGFTASDLLAFVRQRVAPHIKPAPAQGQASQQPRSGAGR